jgi:hypothetical protein
MLEARGSRRALRLCSSASSLDREVDSLDHCLAARVKVIVRENCSLSGLAMIVASIWLGTSPSPAQSQIEATIITEWSTSSLARPFITA